MSYTMYRNTSLGQSLQESLYELLQHGLIPAALVQTVLLQFDKSINEALSTRLRDKVIFHSGKLCTYRFCDNVWTFVLKDVDMRVGHNEIGQFNAVKIVACDANAANASKKVEQQKQQQKQQQEKEAEEAK